MRRVAVTTPSRIHCIIAAAASVSLTSRALSDVTASTRCFITAFYCAVNSVRSVDLLRGQWRDYKRDKLFFATAVQGWDVWEVQAAYDGPFVNRDEIFIPRMFIPNVLLCFFRCLDERLKAQSFVFDQPFQSYEKDKFVLVRTKP